MQYQYPVLLWRDGSGNWTAVLVEGGTTHKQDEEGDGASFNPHLELAALGTTREAALGQLEEDLRQRLRRNPNCLTRPLLQDLQLHHFTMKLRPAYFALGRFYPCGWTFRCTLPCVTGRMKDNLTFAHLPTLGEYLLLEEGETAKEQVARYVAQLGRVLEPTELARWTVTGEAELAFFPLRLEQPRRSEAPAVSVQVLAEVAEPVVGPGIRSGSPTWEREEEVTALMQALDRDRTSLLLVGETGVGKSAVIREAVARLARREPDGGIWRRRCWRTSAARLISGQLFLGMWQRRCEQVIEELREHNGILWLEQLRELLQLGGEGPESSLAMFLLPYLRAGELRLVTEATPEELHACRRLLPGLVEQFQLCPIRSFAAPQARRILEQTAASLQQQTRIPVDAGVPELVRQLHQRFLPYGGFPGEAISFLRGLFEGGGEPQATDFAPGPQASKAPDRVETRLVLGRFTRRTGLPERLLRDDLPLPVEEVRAALEQQVLGQPRACQLVAEVVTTLKAGLQDPRRPVAALLCCGPTGVGKTRLAQVLAQFCFGEGGEARLIRLDMSEYATPGAASRLLGEADGPGSPLVEQVRRQPFVVLLFDELEKADPEVFDVLLNLLDEGRLTDAYGRPTNFRSCIIVMTSNLGVRSRDAAGFAPADGESYLKEVRAFFRPEFVNRLSDLVIFDPLDPATIRAITNKELGELGAREGLERRGLRLTWDPAVVDLIARTGFHPRYGARNLQRTLEELVVAPLARHLVAHPEQQGPLHLQVDADGTIEIR